MNKCSNKKGYSTYDYKNYGWDNWRIKEKNVWGPFGPPINLSPPYGNHFKSTYTAMFSILSFLFLSNIRYCVDFEGGYEQVLEKIKGLLCKNIPNDLILSSADVAIPEKMK